MAQDSDLHFYSNEPPAPYPSLVRVLVRVVVRVELICLFLMKYLLFWPTDKMATRTISIMIASQRAKERVVYITRTTREKERELNFERDKNDPVKFRVTCVFLRREKRSSIFFRTKG